jgi:hypothetical protein
VIPLTPICSIQQPDTVLCLFSLLFIKLPS